MSYDSDVVSATSGSGGDVDWDKIIKLCDRIRDSYGPTAMGSALSAVMRRVKHTDLMVQLQALTLLEACVSNCGRDFQSELTKTTFHSQVREVLSSRSIDPKTIQRLKTLLVTWSSDYRNNGAMSGLVRFVDQLVSEGVITVQGGGGAQPLAPPTSNTSPSTQEDDLQQAIRLSLEEAKSSTNSNVSIYPSFSPQQNKKEPTGRKVRALYDFDAVEDNELSFKAGEIITVTDDSNDKWWRGETQIGKGLFPVSFVSTDLNASPEPVVKAKKTSSTGNAAGNKKAANVTINEQQVDLLLEMLKTADITSTNKEENKTLKDIEGQCTVMKGLVEKEIGNHQRQIEEMEEVSQKLQESFQLYRNLLKDGPRLAEKASMVVHQLPPQSHEGGGPPPYQSNGSYYPPPPQAEPPYHTLPTQTMGYSQPYAPPISGGLSQHTIPQYAPPGSITGQQLHYQQQQPTWNGGGGGGGQPPQQLFTAPPPLSTYQPLSMNQPLI